MNDPLPEARRWLRQAEVELEAASLLAERLPALACFHCQQAAEKALKAILYAVGVRPVLGHSVGMLGEAVRQRTSAFEALVDEAAKLDRYYIATRYPNGLPEGGDPSTAFDEGDARSAIEVAEQVIAHARSFLADAGSAE